MDVEFLIGDCSDTLATLPDESVHCIVTSPPYFGLRCDGQIGLEPTPDEFCAAMIQVFREVRRVLRDDGTVWLNLGDSYARDSRVRWNSTMHSERGWKCNQAMRNAANVVRDGGLKPKDRMMIPARVALALQADGWWLRDEIIWHKPNPMPASVTDRTTPAHEMIYLLTKSSRYYYDADAVMERAVCDRIRGPALHADTKSTNGNGGLARRPLADTRNRRSVWTVTTKPFKGAHFATFPPDLIEPCILAGCPLGGTVLDPFGGAGTTGLVAQQYGRNAILCELNPEYAAMARERIDEATATPLEKKRIRAKHAPRPAPTNQVTLFS